MQISKCMKQILQYAIVCTMYRCQKEHLIPLREFLRCRHSVQKRNGTNESLHILFDASAFEKATTIVGSEHDAGKATLGQTLCLLLLVLRATLN